MTHILGITSKEKKRHSSETPLTNFFNSNSSRFKHYFVGRPECFGFQANCSQNPQNKGFADLASCFENVANVTVAFTFGLGFRLTYIMFLRYFVQCFDDPVNTYIYQQTMKFTCTTFIDKFCSLVIASE